MQELFVIARLQVDECEDQHKDYYDYEGPAPEVKYAIWKKSAKSAHKFGRYEDAEYIVSELIKECPYANTCYQIDKIFKS